MKEDEANRMKCVFFSGLIIKVMNIIFFTMFPELRQECLSPFLIRESMESEEDATEIA